MRPVTAYATSEPNAPFARTTIERRDLGPTDVLIKISFAGICHSDIHTARGEWGKVTFPLVPGHEIAGFVEETGAEVTRHAVGDRVGVGCMVDSCRKCENCVAGHQQYCSNGPVFTYNDIGKDGRPTEGGYSSHIVVDQDFVLKIPAGLDLDVAAPLLCAGITLYSPLKRWGAGPGMPVAIVGFGGLGHMGVKIAHALGAEVTVLSQSLSKQEDGKRFGADHYYATSRQITLRGAAEQFRPHRVHGVGQTADELLPVDVATRRRPGERRRASRWHFAERLLADGQPTQPCRLEHRQHCRDSRNAGLLRRAWARCRDRGHKCATRSGTLMTESSRAMCATAS